MPIKIAQLRAKSVPELADELARSEAELRTLRFDAASGKLKNVKALRGVRKKKARLLTLISEKKKIS